MKKILIILTSHAAMENTDSKTGVWLGEFTGPYYEFIDAGFEVVLASPKGGKPPIDPLSKLTENITASNRRFDKDEAAVKAFENTATLANLNQEKFDALFYPGGHGPLWDLASDRKSGQLILDFLNNGKPVASVCHGPAALIQAAEMDSDILKNKKITGFSNLEETLVLRSKNIPYNLEDRLKELGADYSSATIPYTSHVLSDGLLITGQNPASADKVAQELIKLLGTSESSKN